MTFASLFNKINFFGIDISATLVKKVRSELENSNIKNVELFCDNFITTHCLLDKKFDLIYAGDSVTCYLTTNQLATALDKLSCHLTKNGSMVLSIDLPSRKTIELMQLNRLSKFHLASQGIFPHQLNELLYQTKNLRLTALRAYFTNEKRIGIFPESDTFWCEFSNR